MILRGGYGPENGLVRKRDGRETAGFPSPSSFEAILIALETQTEIIKKSLNTYLRNCLPFFLYQCNENIHRNISLSIYLRRL